jgi:hypothetical protein
MKIHVLVNPIGEAIATFEEPSGSESYLKPEVPKEHQLKEVEVPDNYKSDLSGFYKKLRSK